MGTEAEIPPFSLTKDGVTYYPFITTQEDKRKCLIQTFTEGNEYLLWGQVVADNLVLLNKKIYDNIISKENTDYDIELFFTKK